MNPLFMMFGPMGFFGGGCCCGVNMPFYRDDRLLFMNVPVIRDPSMDYLLDPRLAMMQGMQNWMYGGNMYGSTYLPPFNFPGMNPPWLNNNNNNSNSNTNSNTNDTPEVKEQKNKIEKYKKYFDILKKNLDNDDDEFKAIKNLYDEALKESKPEDQVKKLEEAFNQLNPEILRNIALADEKISSKLFKAGYNFTKDNSFGHEPTNTEVDWEAELKRYNFADQVSVGGFGSPTGKLGTNSDQILQVISTWNDTHKADDEKGLLRVFAKHLPKERGKQRSWQDTITTLTNALTTKTLAFANEYGGIRKFANLDAQQTKVNELLNEIKKWSAVPEDTSDTTAAIKDDDEIALNKKKEQIKKLADEFDKLYVMMRILEAKSLNSKIIKEYGEMMNSIKANSIPEDIIIKETLEDLEAEKAQIPSEDEIDELPEKRGIRITRTREESEMDSIDKETKNDPEKRIEKLIEKEKLKPAEDGREGIYETTADGTYLPKKYYGISNDDKLVEVKLNTVTNEYEKVSDKDTTAAEIGQYNDTANKLNEYISSGKLKKTNIKNLYYSGYAHFMIMNNKLVRINGTVHKDGAVVFEDGSKKTIKQLTSSDVTEVTSESDLYVKPQKPSKPATENKTENSDAKDNTVTENKPQKKNINTKSEAYKKGDEVGYNLSHSVKKSDKKINEALKSVDKDNVLDFLAGYYSHDFHEGIIEYMDDEWDGGDIEMANKKHLINSFIEYAEAHGIAKEDERINEIKEILKDYEDGGEYEGKNTFNHNDGWLGWIDIYNGFWKGLSTAFGDRYTHNEIIDEHIKSLFEELKKNS